MYSYHDNQSITVIPGGNSQIETMNTAVAQRRLRKEVLNKGKTAGAGP